MAMALAQCLVVDGRGVEEHEVDHGRDLAEDGHPLLTTGAEAANTASSKLDSGHGTRSPVSQAEHRLDERPSRHGPDVLTIDMGELDHVEEGRGIVDVLQAEPLEHLADVEDLLAGKLPPSRLR